MRNILILISVILLLCLSNYKGHIDPPFSIDFTPVIIGLTTVIVLFFTDLKLWLKLGLTTFYIILNDVLIKLYAGGAHDLEGAGFIFIAMAIGLIVSLIALIIYLIKEKVEKKSMFKFILTPILGLALYLSYFHSLGMSFDISSSMNQSKAKKDDIFISDLVFSKDILVFGSDTLFVQKGWIEHEVKFDHTNLVKTSYKSQNNNLVLILDGSPDLFDSHGRIYSKVISPKTYWANNISKNIYYTVDKGTKEFEISFYQTNKKDEVKTIIGSY